eukprot:jgi/Mesvir1/1760/Mv14042-RA.1
MLGFPRVAQKEIQLKQQREQDALDAQTQDIAERAPAFLKDKGDDLYKAKNYRGAVNAYSRAIEKDPSLASCYSNRAACYLQLGEAESCELDCTAALALLEEEIKGGYTGPDDCPEDDKENQRQGSGAAAMVSSNPQGRGDDTTSAAPRDSNTQPSTAALAPSNTPTVPSSDAKVTPQALTAATSMISAGESAWLQSKHEAMARVLARRARARVARDDLQGASEDLTLAIRLKHTGTQDLEQDLQEVEDCRQPPDVATLKRRAAARFEARDYEGAVTAYSAALQVADASRSGGEEVWPLYSNRAAAHIHLERFSDAVDDCHGAIEALLTSSTAGVWLASRITASQGIGFQKCSDAGSSPPSGDEPCPAPSATLSALMSSGGKGIAGPWDVSPAVRDSLRANSREQSGRVLDASGPATEYLFGASGWPIKGDRSGSLLKLLSRRALARAHLKHYEGALGDYEAAALLAHARGDARRAGELDADGSKIRAIMASSGSQ